MGTTGRSAAGTTVAAGASTSLLVGRDRSVCEGWRTFLVLTTGPVDVTLQWVSSAGVNSDVTFTASRTTRVCVWASSWALDVQNLDASADVLVRASMVDTFQPEVKPIFEERFAETGVGTATHTPPAWAVDVRLNTDDQAMTGAVVELLDCDDVVRAGVTGARQPDWLPLGGAAAVRVTSAAPYRLLWRLSLV